MNETCFRVYAASSLVAQLVSLPSCLACHQVVNDRKSGE